MEKYGLNQLREMFLSYFESKQHLRLNSFSLIPQNDPSLLLINSGMAPMKPWFTGEQTPPRTRVTTCQRCIRTGDIENIGKTDRHGTYFEMLGNFSFGDYFKKEAIPFAWEFLTKVVGIPEDLLYPSIYLDDEEAFEIWTKDVGVAPERITRFGKADNFWEHGPGPCGPCSEIYFDRGVEHGCGKPDCKVGCDCDRFIEVWNVVFSQFNNDGNDNYTELEQKNIDTGMGLERLAVVCQGVNSLFDVDTVMNITNKVSQLTCATYGQSTEKDVSLRVITDHIRASVMMITDGVQPSNEGRGYVLRRLIRRAARHGRLLGMNKPFLHEIVSTVVNENKGAYPEVAAREEYVTRVIKIEEENFSRTIDAGMGMLNNLIEGMKSSGETVLKGSDAFRLYDTYGFPPDLTREILAEQGMSYDEAEFKAAMEEQRVRAREARAALGELAWTGVDLGLEPGATPFTGYDELDSEAKILAMVADGEVCSVLQAGKEGVIVLDTTPFYAEMGGQTADNGLIVTDEAVFRVTNVQKNKGGKYLHHGVMEQGELHVDDEVTASVDEERRAAICRAHPATHMLQKALRTVLGDHVHQAGSLVEPDRLRFDLTHFEAVTLEQLREVEDIVNEELLAGQPVITEVLPIEEARKKGAMSLFGEKYGDEVRVVTMGDSVEFCGGTHLDNTAKAGIFTVISESSVASGVRRIEAVTGEGTIAQLRKSREELSHVAAIMKLNSVGEVVSKVEAQTNEIRELRRQLEVMKAREAAAEADRIVSSGKDVKGFKVIASAVREASVDKLRTMGDTIRNDDNAVAVLASVNDGKITFLACCGKNAVKAGIRAGDIIKHVARMCGGSGGGKPDTAMGGGRDVGMLGEALESIRQFVADKLA